jgi:hypothetical protein
VKLLIPEEPLQVLPTLAAEIGVNEAIVLQQVHYWSLVKLKQDQEPWVYNTQGEWLKQFPWLTERTLQRVIAGLRERDLILTQQPEGTNRRTHYQVNYEALPDAAILADSSRHIGGLSNNKTETSTEKPPTNTPSSDDLEKVWAVYVESMKPRRTELHPDERKIIRDALKVASADELSICILTCSRSDYHMKRGAHSGRSGGKYNKLGQILKPRPRRGETARSRIDWWLEKAEEEARQQPQFDVNAEAERMRREQGL